MQNNLSKNICIMLLAAGESSRLGTPKQLLMYRGKNLMQHTIDLTQEMGLDTVLVLGAFSEQILKHIRTYDLKVVKNRNWDEGLASSIRCGLEHLLSMKPEMEAVMLVLCDQPFLSAEILRQILEKYQETGLPIVHCHYGEASGPPTLFDKSMFPYLLELKGGHGAKKIVDRFPDMVAFIDFPEGSLDIDTPEDYHKLIDES